MDSSGGCRPSRKRAIASGGNGSRCEPCSAWSLGGEQQKSGLPLHRPRAVVALLTPRSIRYNSYTALGPLREFNIRQRFPPPMLPPRIAAAACSVAHEREVTGFSVMPWLASFRPAFNLATSSCNDCQAAEVALKSLHRSE